MDNPDTSSVTVSAPGKLMLLGEHSVVYGHPCLVTSVKQRLNLSVSFNTDKMFNLKAPEVGIASYTKPLSGLSQGEIPKGARFIEAALKNYISCKKVKSGINISTKSDFSASYGFGSSSASAVCLIKALSEICGHKLDDKQIFNLSYKTVMDVQGAGSGFDVASAVYGGTLYYVSPGKVIERLPTENIPLIVGYTGVKADTVAIVGDVARKKSQNPEKVARIFAAVTKLVDETKKKIVESDWERVGRLFDFNQDYLRDLGVSTEKLETLISAAKSAGAYGAKLSGAGGGDCMIAIAPPESFAKVKDAINSAGGTVIDVSTNVPGVTII
jgi:mevalonate kinase